MCKDQRTTADAAVQGFAAADHREGQKRWPTEYGKRVHRIAIHTIMQIASQSDTCFVSVRLSVPSCL